MRTIMKYTIQILTLAILFTLNGCKKDDVKTHCSECTISGEVVYLPIGCVGNSTTLGIQDEKGNFYYVDTDKTGHFRKYKEGDKICFDFKAKDDCSIALTPGHGIMEIPIQCVELTCVGQCAAKDEECYTVTYIPTQCADNEFSTTLGIKDAKGNYYLVNEDKTGTFNTLVKGDKIKAKFEKVKECMVCYACTCPKPDACIILYSYTKCDAQFNDCAKAYLKPDYIENVGKQEYHGITPVGFTYADTYRTKGTLNIKVGVSGCDGNIKPDLIIRKSTLKSYPQIYDCYLSFNRKPQLCEAAFQVPVCYNFDEFLQNENHAKLVFHASNGETTSLIID